MTDTTQRTHACTHAEFPSELEELDISSCQLQPDLVDFDACLPRLRVLIAKDLTFHHNSNLRPTRERERDLWYVPYIFPTLLPHQERVSVADASKLTLWPSWWGVVMSNPGVCHRA
jgi:hypothetical protein